ncbi:DUF6093 family protein [Streptomyces sp900116325]|uniref:DUF6093 family protein n=1 Tax=Streptomyces sp. 900116325 TaxID=3154295 RepID=A0ABV2UAC9_9ACTN
MPTRSPSSAPRGSTSPHRRPGREPVPVDLSQARADLEAQLTDTVRISRTAGQPVLDPVTGGARPDPDHVVYEGPGAVLSTHGQIRNRRTELSNPAPTAYSTGKTTARRTHVQRHPHQCLCLPEYAAPSNPRPAPA